MQNMCTLLFIHLLSVHHSLDDGGKVPRQEVTGGDIHPIVFGPGENCAINVLRDIGVVAADGLFITGVVLLDGIIEFLRIEQIIHG